MFPYKTQVSSIAITMHVLHKYHAGQPRGTQDLLNARLLHHCMAHHMKLNQIRSDLCYSWCYWESLEFIKYSHVLTNTLQRSFMTLRPTTWMHGLNLEINDDGFPLRASYSILIFFVSIGLSAINYGCRSTLRLSLQQCVYIHIYI
jgi:hypothetical protein